MSSCSRVYSSYYVSFSKVSVIYGCLHLSTWSVFSFSSWKMGQRLKRNTTMILNILPVPQKNLKTLYTQFGYKRQTHHAFFHYFPVNHV